jgi:hypothetical protein
MSWDILKFVSICVWWLLTSLTLTLNFFNIQQHFIWMYNISHIHDRTKKFKLFKKIIKSLFWVKNDKICPKITMSTNVMIHGWFNNFGYEKWKYKNCNHFNHPSLLLATYQNGKTWLESGDLKKKIKLWRTETKKTKFLFLKRKLAKQRKPNHTWCNKWQTLCPTTHKQCAVLTWEAMCSSTRKACSCSVVCKGGKMITWRICLNAYKAVFFLGIL